MAKNQLPILPTGGSGAVGKLVKTLLVVAVVVLIVKFPNDAAAFAQGAFDRIGDAINGVVTFLRGLGK
ncbi:hypothetical protein [Saccharopolyspora rosea]|uniref:hypothetical protein n=1 Tax=Saccharopolyspora rosea TaxID=524884 RepID=UPI0021DB78FD|nr:hypothetical protein [Saccharopolyspora rosea]